jgi:hypothetical protein
MLARLDDPLGVDDPIRSAPIRRRRDRDRIGKVREASRADRGLVVAHDLPAAGVILRERDDRDRVAVPIEDGTLAVYARIQRHDGRLPGATARRRRR